jgi:hypothetical protein
MPAQIAAAISAIRNPIDPNQILVFNQAPWGNLALQQSEDTNRKGFNEIRLPEGLPATGEQFSGATSPGCILRTATSLATVRHEELISVYAIDWNNSVSLVSPVYRPVNNGALVAAEGGLAVATADDGSNAGWIYYLKHDQSSGQTQINEYPFDVGDSSALDTSAVLAGTYLAAFVDNVNSTRGVVYQSKGKGLVLAVISGDDVRTTKIGGTENARPQTPLAIEVIDGKDFYLYFVSNQNTLYRSHRPDGSLNWGSAKIVTGAPEVSQITQLGITQNASGKYNSLYYVSKQAPSKITIFRDKW